jgi:DNA-binding beta-propeller fold protein YncE
MVRLMIVLMLGLACHASFAQDKPDAQPDKPESTERRLPGVQPGGMVQLPNQWSLKPAGQQMKLGDFPVNIQLHPTEPYAAILHCGYGEHEIVIVQFEAKTQRVLSRVSLPQAFYGLCFSPEGDQVFASGGDDEVIHRFAFSKGYLSDHRQLPVGNKTDKLVPTGVATTTDGKSLLAACGWGAELRWFPLENPPREGKRTVQLLKLPEDSYPYAVLPSRTENLVYVSLWGAGEVVAIDLAKRSVVNRIPTDSHPTEMILNKDESLLYVACANSNTVHVIDVESGKKLEVITSALYPKARVGSTPNSISLSADEKVLLIANADNNNVAVVDVSKRGKSHGLGFIPVGWYPTSVRFSKSGEKIYVANGKGQMSQANPQGPAPGKSPPATIVEYIGGLFRGTLSVIDAPSPADMAKHTKTAFACSPLREDEQPVARPREKDNPIPAKVGDKSPIKHCLYIVKENRTYDHVFGDMEEGNGDPNLCLFPERVTPNHHALARQFVLLDNFYVESEVSADGHEWTMAAYASDFVEKTWPLLYRGNRYGKLAYPAEGQLPVSPSSGGYFWDLCAKANVSYRSYGEFVANGKTPNDPATARVKSLEGHFDPQFRGYDLNYSDQKRADRFIAEWQRLEGEGKLPQFQVLRLPNDHTSGTAPDKPTPTAMVADNDLALGRIVEAISRTKAWKETAIFVVEDDAQNGSDHVDAHRTVAMVISPFTKRKFVDSSLYSTASMLRTMELILGLPPMSQFDAAALPMYNSFQAEPDFAQYEHRPANVDLNAKNLASAWGAKMSLAFDFSKEDAADDLLLNEVIWRSVKGAESVMPAPVRAGFVFAVPESEEDEDDDDD